MIFLFFFCHLNLGFWFTLMLCPSPWFEEIIKSFSGLNHSEGIKLLMLRICMDSMKKKTDCKCLEGLIQLLDLVYFRVLLASDVNLIWEAK